MKKNSIIKSATSITLLAALALTGCSATSTSNASATATSATSTSASNSSGTKSKAADSFSTDVKSGAKLAEDTHYSAKDLTWDSSSEVAIDLSNHLFFSNHAPVKGANTIQIQTDRMIWLFQSTHP